ncbi:MAG TPA: HAMP domain-containing sensor histidine kinase [Bacteroidales bacterium]|jgi:two-component system phosphate regulon sensor histidine kinase PhoR|nr:HAMP domain-containing sensor histidine kinase [Bacteroidales bacterium]HQH25670.1 HAMP domain-containing sensor histidine kinase [Bacteroidales bacterium]HQJ83316.1 HAMP domain-containing sensor histidine kinase [Bacteroidales bacterium]
MSRKKFIWLIFMMLVSLIGIIWVQSVWIRNAVGTQNENFDAAVIAGINDAAGSIETARELDFFNNFMFSGSRAMNGLTDDISQYLSVDSYLSPAGEELSVRITNQAITRTPGQDPVVVVHDTVIKANGDSSIIFPSVRRSAIPGPDDKAGMIPGKESSYVQQQEFIEWVKKRQNEFQNIGNRMISEIYSWEKSLALDDKEIEFALKRSLLFRNIQTPFEFAVIRNGIIDEGRYKKTDVNDFIKSKYKVSLFPHSFIQQDLILSVIFPERTNYVLGSMAWVLSASLLFSLIILATFAMSLSFIFRQKKISEMKSDFLNNMTHEFKTPIATISLAADTIVNSRVIGDESKIRHFISMIKKENSRMNKKVETILQISSLDRKEISFNFENLSLHSIIERAVDSTDIIVQQRKGRVNLHLDASEPVVCGDEEHLYNLVNNLLDNAIKYSPGSPEITVSTKNNGRGVIMTVEDRGTGMSKSVQNRIFERFYRKPSGNVHNVKGFGLGLNYVQAIVNAHRGNITVHSESGRGSRFDVFIPFNPENER